MLTKTSRDGPIIPTDLNEIQSYMNESLNAHSISLSSIPAIHVSRFARPFFVLLNPPRRLSSSIASATTQKFSIYPTKDKQHSSVRPSPAWKAWEYCPKFPALRFQPQFQAEWARRDQEGGLGAVDWFLCLVRLQGGQEKG